MRNSAGPDDAPDTAPVRHVRPRHVAPLRTANDRTARLGLERPPAAAEFHIKPLDRVGAWIEAANRSRDNRVELLHDHEPPVRPLHDPLQLGQLMTGSEQEVRAVGTDIFVLVECGGDSLGARGIRAFADELGIGGVEPSGALSNSLVDVPEQRFSVRDPHFSFSHPRLPSIDCQIKNAEAGESVAPNLQLCGLKR